MKNKKIAIVLSGCGHTDGTEITEAVSLIIALSSYGAELTFFAPEKQMQDSARITRGQIVDLKNLNAQDFDGLAFPGGYGAAKYLCDWASKQSQCSIHPQVEKAILDFFQQSKPIAAICIAPVLIAKVLGHRHVEITLGTDPGIMKEAGKTGAHLVECPTTDFITDRSHKIVSTPAYMDDHANPHHVFLGISGLVKEFIEMA